MCVDEICMSLNFNESFSICYEFNTFIVNRKINTSSTNIFVINTNDCNKTNKYNETKQKTERNKKSNFFSKFGQFDCQIIWIQFDRVLFVHVFFRSLLSWVCVIVIFLWFWCLVSDLNWFCNCPNRFVMWSGDWWSWYASMRASLNCAVVVVVVGRSLLFFSFVHFCIGSLQPPERSNNRLVEHTERQRDQHSQSIEFCQLKCSTNRTHIHVHTDNNNVIESYTERHTISLIKFEQKVCMKVPTVDTHKMGYGELRTLLSKEK